MKARRRGRAVPAAAALVVLAGACRTASAADPEGVWMIEGEVALAVARCGAGRSAGASCGCWTPRDDAGRPKRDAMNPDAALRDRPLCGLTVLDGLLPVPGEPGRWTAGSFYDPRTGRGYGLTATLVSADVLVARVYVGMPFLGKNQTLLRVRRARARGGAERPDRDPACSRPLGHAGGDGQAPARGRVARSAGARGAGRDGSAGAPPGSRGALVAPPESSRAKGSPLFHVERGKTASPRGGAGTRRNGASMPTRSHRTGAVVPWAGAGFPIAGRMPKEAMVRREERDVRVRGAFAVPAGHSSSGWSTPPFVARLGSGSTRSTTATAGSSPCSKAGRAAAHRLPGAGAARAGS